MRKRTTWLVLLAIATGAALSFDPRRKSAAQTNTSASSKVSPDLARHVQRGAVDRIPVVIQMNSTTSPIDSLLKSLGGTLLRDLKKLNLRVVEIPPIAVEALARRSDVRYISPDRQVNSFGHVTDTTGTDAIRIQTNSLLGELITTTTVFDGSGIGIAIIDSGLDAEHHAFRNSLGLSRVIASRDFTGESQTNDAYGHGTHVASLAAGSGQIANGAYSGIAPGASLINLRVLNSQGTGSTSSLLAALDWVMTYRSLYGIRVVNMSIGTAAIDSSVNDPVCRAVRALTDVGIVVVAAAGNNGKSSSGQKIYGQIHSPGNETSAITVGASNSFGSDQRGDDSVTSFSSRGPTRSFWADENGAHHYDNSLKPDLVAPGNRIIGAAADDNFLLSAHPELDAGTETTLDRRMMYLSGSSMSAPLVSGAAAVLLQANPNLTPSLVKAILMYTAQPLAGANTFEQGAGQINVEGAMRLAKLIRTDLTNFTPLGASLLTAATPAQETHLNGETFSWSRGVILNHSYLSGVELITKYQKVYGDGFVLADGITETSSDQTVNFTRMTSGILPGSSIVTSDGTVLSEGPVFLDLGLLLNGGPLLPDGIMVGDGVMVGDGIMVGDGVMVGDSVLNAQSILTAGDETSAMR